MKTPEEIKECKKQYDKKYYNNNTKKVYVRINKWKSNHPESVKKIRQKQHLKHTYGIPIEQYYEMLTLQMSGCTICKKTIVENAKFLAVDHNHTTGKVRGLLCNKCNRLLGFANDNPELLRKAADYLDKYNSS